MPVVIDIGLIALKTSAGVGGAVAVSVAPCCLQSEPPAATQHRCNAPVGQEASSRYENDAGHGSVPASRNRAVGIGGASNES